MVLVLSVLFDFDHFDVFGAVSLLIGAQWCNAHLNMKCDALLAQRAFPDVISFR